VSKWRINMLSKTQIDHLGDRLKKGEISDADLRVLDEYRRSFSEGYDFVIQAIRAGLGLESTGRPAKSTTSIIEKLQRESIRLTQIQDIAGCRIIVPRIVEQQTTIESVNRLFESTVTVDRRESPSHGYRAVHIVVKSGGHLIEVQIRSSLQHIWAELSEKFADLIDPAIKYGKGDETTVAWLQELSTSIAVFESQELQVVNLEKQVSDTLSEDAGSKDQEELLKLREEISALRIEQDSFRERMLEKLRDIVVRGENDISY
jgi:putative GTP pyrophosphokinase